MKRQLPDHQARITALTDIRRSLLVEAGAGSGKTSIIAGRVAVLLASGVHPKNIAAITFTEFAVSELHRRIEFFVDALCRGQIPEDIKIAFPEVSPEQRSNLERARDGLDQLVCTTIHGFAQVLIKPYPAEAEIDPGAEIVDPAEADLAFNERYNAWLRKHLSGAAEDDIVSQVVMADEDGGLALIRSVADFLRRNRDAAPFPCIWSLKAAKTFGAAASKFKKEMGRFKFREQKTEDACKAFVEMAGRLSLLEARMGKQGKREFVQVLRLMEAFKIEEVTAAVRDAMARGAIGFDTVKHLTLCRIERRGRR